MVAVDELHDDAATEDLLASAGDLQSFFDQLGLEVAAGGGGEAAEEELEWLSNKDVFPTVDTMELEPTLMGPRIKVVRRQGRRADEELDWLPSKNAFLEVEMAEPQPAVTKVVSRLGREEVELDWLPNQDAFPAVRIVDPEPAVTKVVRRRRRMLRRRADEELDWLPNKDAYLDLEVETAEPEPAVTKMVLRPRRAGASIAQKAAEPDQRQCSHCGTTKTPHWRAGPDGLRTLCNACDKRHRGEPPVPKYRRLISATFRPAPELHTSMPRRIVQMCRSSATLVDVAVCLASPTRHLSRSPRRTKEAVCRKSRKPFRTARGGNLQASSDQAGLEVAAGRGGEEELEWPSNEDAFPVLEMTELQLSLVEPRTKGVVRQGRRAAEPGQRWCQHCGSMKMPQWRVGLAEEEDKERDWLPNKNAPALETMEPSVVVTRQRRRAAASSPSAATVAELGQRRCWHCGRTETPQWREGPEGPHTLCNACGIRYRRGGLVPE
ncbi:unnamed protein product [Alopecurus aequalis]